MVMLDPAVEPKNDEVDSSSSPRILCQTVNPSATSSPPRRLRLCMLGCEDNPPYGPTEHTGQLFMELIVQSLAECDPTTTWIVSIAIYRVQQGEYPDDWNLYDGILLPGSFAAAYDTDPWIEKLKHVIQNEIVAHRRPTLGICFGHQVFAHSFEDGQAQKYPRGSRAGRYAMTTTPAGAALFGKQHNLYYTHGDMVQKLPPCAVALGTEDELPVQAAAYFASAADAQAFPSANKPYTVTFQAHPEYGVSRDLGLDGTLRRIFHVMTDKELIQKEYQVEKEQDAIESFDTVHRQSKEAFIASARALGWFP
ncbi:glutamine amidotransferase [Seminavis robusta]|uniref:Glutamine amidotransferase n=1 Tax=Seminavis robusta TaxID=568900 RepID=A0A9N8DQI6_9STRA|nr:glutamine amidotransferase [Seminavis robusta]|eukprot:Sro186_g080570.1 glutamine amidotransferase (309) ;mRNA; f:12006-12932